jgi:hypothetical protein
MRPDLGSWDTERHPVVAEALEDELSRVAPENGSEEAMEDPMLGAIEAPTTR